ncbi:hypothetical protein [Nocardioides aurantiacus]|uniref:hypothetical protein n=1 Tax=Nocardioides aurantiacus TaxID=86796 RepID=UPI0014769862|nr:hypothetical protein [Nocardioides aurantiacus]
MPAFHPGEEAALWREITATAVAAPQSRWARWRPVAAGVVAAVALGGAGAATASVISAHTGRGPVDTEDVELGGPGERLDPAAPDFAAVLDTTTADIAFPSVQARTRALAWETDDLSSDPEPSLVSAGAVRLWTSGHALCAWSNTWAVALRDGDDDAAKRSAAVILSARTWPPIRDTDPDLANQSEFAWLPDLERAVRDRDPSAAKDALSTDGSCLPGLAPQLGLGPR